MNDPRKIADELILISREINLLIDFLCKQQEQEKKWVGLTDEERFTANYNLDPYKHALEIEAKLKEKNT